MYKILQSSKGLVVVVVLICSRWLMLDLAIFSFQGAARSMPILCVGISQEAQFTQVVLAREGLSYWESPMLCARL